MVTSSVLRLSRDGSLVRKDNAVKSYLALIYAGIMWMLISECIDILLRGKMSFGGGSCVFIVLKGRQSDFL